MKDRSMELLAHAWAKHCTSSPVWRIGTRDGTIIETHPGETVACPPGEEHWHGATAEQFMEHLALWEGDGADKPETNWLEPVTDEQYNGPRSNATE
jgi:hypothetical protein